MKTVLFTLVAAGLVLSGCSQETTGNTDRRERDRANEKTQIISDEYAKATGLYTGHSEQGTIRLEVKTAFDRDSSQPGAGATTPQPILIGVMSVYPDMEIQGKTPLVIGMPIDSGTYSDGTKNMTLLFKFADSTSRLVCDLHNPDDTQCQWFTSHGVSTMDLQKLPADTQIEAVKAQTPGTYNGVANGFKIQTEFRMTYQSPTSGQGVRTLINARFVFTNQETGTSEEYTSTTGAFDPQTDTISLPLNGDGNILVSCRRASRTHLDCEWNSTRYFSFSLDANADDSVDQPDDVKPAPVHGSKPRHSKSRKKPHTPRAS